MANSRVADDFFGKIPRRSVVLFHVAVFFIFAPVSLLFVSSIEPQRPWLAIVANLVVSGLIAVCWAATFTVSRWFIVGIVLTNVAMVLLSTFLQDTPIGIQSARTSWLGVGFVAAVVMGYVLFVVFISGQGRTTMRLMTEMSLARNIHETLVPPLRFSNERIEASGLSVASTEMGGDLIDVVDHGESTDLFLADVSGHGVRAGVVMGMVKSAIRMGLRRREALRDLLSNLNDVLSDTTSAELYATFAGLRVNGSGGVEYALAGHHHIVLQRAGADVVERLSLRGFPLGLFDGRTYDTATVDLSSGDLLAVYSDGLNETADESGRELGHDAIESALTRLAGRPLDDIRRAVFDLATEHGGQEDDRTLLLVRCR